VGEVVGIYLKTNHMPVRFLISIAMTALNLAALAGAWDYRCLYAPRSVMLGLLQILNLPGEAHAGH
jgi:hypothetical protein